MLLIKNADIFTPQAIGTADLLVAGSRIEAIAPHIRIEGSLEVEEIDARGQRLCPGLVDSLVHITGGGGEGGFTSRTPELNAEQAVRAGVTTLVGALGTDSETRTLGNLVAKTKALNEQGLNCFCHTGSYQVPVRTLTGSIERDLLYVQEMIGVGEVALADHRSSQPSLQQLKQLVAEARVGGMLSGKGGKVLVHMGDHSSRLELIEELIATTDIPPGQFQITHVNRNRPLFEAATRFALAGGNIDLTTSTSTAFAQEVPCGEGLKSLLEQGVDPARISFSSDAQASLPAFDAHGSLTRLEIGRIASLTEALWQAVAAGVDFATALAVVSRSPADTLKLAAKGRIEVGADADLVLFKEQQVHTLISRGKLLMHEGRLQMHSLFDA